MCEQTNIISLNVKIGVLQSTLCYNHYENKCETKQHLKVYRQNKNERQEYKNLP